MSIRGGRVRFSFDVDDWAAKGIQGCGKASPSTPHSDDVDVRDRQDDGPAVMKDRAATILWTAGRAVSTVLLQ